MSAQEQPKDLKTWAALLHDATNEPGIIDKCYHMFHDYSIGNQLLALSQHIGLLAVADF